MKALAIFVGFIGATILMAISSIFNGYALSVLWGWFMVPTFSLPQLSVAPAIGLAMIVDYLTKQFEKSKKDENFGKSILKDIIIAILKPSFALFFGYIVHLFM